MNKLKGKTAVITGGTAALDWHRRRSSPGRGQRSSFQGATRRRSQSGVRATRRPIIKFKIGGYR